MDNTEMDDVGSVFQQLNKYMVRSEYDQALMLIENQLIHSDSSWALYHSAGLCCFGLQKFREAIQFFDKAHHISANQYPSLIAMASCYVHLGRLNDALYSYKLSLTVDNQYPQYMLPEMVDFHQNLALWHEDRLILLAHAQIKEGEYAQAQQHLLSYVESKDPTVEIFALMIDLSLKLGHYGEALRWSADFYQTYQSDDKFSNFYSAKALCAMGQFDIAQQFIEECFHSSKSEIIAGALNLALKFGLSSSQNIDELIRQFWGEANNKESKKCVVFKQRDQKQSVGIFVGNLDIESPARWLLQAVQFFDGTIYFDQMDYWAEEFFRNLNCTLIDISEIDPDTLDCILSRNHHDALLDISSLNEFSRFDIHSSVGKIQTVGLVGSKAHLKGAFLNGFDQLVLPNDTDLGHCIPLSQVALIPVNFGNFWQFQDKDEFFIALAMSPADISVFLPVMLRLLQLDERIQFSINETICGDAGLDLIMCGFRQEGSSKFLDRIKLFSQSNLKGDEEIVEHLSDVDLYISSGRTSYDIAALGQRTPIVYWPFHLGYVDYSRHIFEAILPAEQCSASEDTLVQKIADWLNSLEDYQDDVISYQQKCADLSNAAEHFQRILILTEIFIKKEI